MPKVVTLPELAKELGVTREQAWKIAGDLGVQGKKQRLPEFKHRQEALTWTPEQVKEIKAKRRQDGFPVP